jgi:Tfp pilus assembly protein PilV
MEKLLALVIVFACILGLIGVFVVAIRGARKSSNRAAVLGWALQFFGVGMNPLPPPQEQIEEANRQNRVKKAAVSTPGENCSFVAGENCTL